MCVSGTLRAQEPPKVPAEERTAPAAEQPVKPGEGLISNVYENTDIRTVLSEMGTQAGVVIVPDQTVEGAVSMELKNVPLEQALTMVLATGGFVYKKMDGFYLVGLPKADSPTFPTFSETRTLKLNYVAADAAVKAIAPAFAPYVKANPTTNTLWVTAPPALLERIIGDLRDTDKPPLHVMLDARIVTIERNDLLNLGVQWNWPTVEAGAFSSSDMHGGGAGQRSDWPWGVEIGYTTGKEFTNALLLTLNLLGQNDEATIIANPQLMAQDGKEAEIKVNTEEYFQITTPSTYYVQAQLEKIESGTVLKITPRIGEKGDITLEMSTEVSDVVARGKDNLPVVTRRTAKSTVRIEDGGTAVVAGLMDTRTRSNRRDVPGASAVPILGSLFRDREDSRTSRQVAVFVTARLMPVKPPEPAKAAPPKPPVKLAGKEFKDALRESLQRIGEGNER